MGTDPRPTNDGLDLAVSIDEISHQADRVMAERRRLLHALVALLTAGRTFVGHVRADLDDVVIPDVALDAACAAFEAALVQAEQVMRR